MPDSSNKRHLAAKLRALAKSVETSTLGPEVVEQLHRRLDTLAPPSHSREGDLESSEERSEHGLHSEAFLAAISRAQVAFISKVAASEVFDALLSSFLELTDSEYGFIAELERDADSTRFLRSRAITNVSWDAATRAFYEEHAPTGLEFRKLDNLFGHVALTGEHIIANDPGGHPKSAGVPDGHPPLRSFVGLPLYFGRELVGMVGLANRPGGYDQNLVDFLNPCTTSVGSIIQAYRIDKRRERAEEALRRATNEWERTFDASPDPILLVDNEYCVSKVNKAFAEAVEMTPQEVIGRTCHELMHGQSSPPEDCPHRRFIDCGEECIHEYSLTFGDGIYDVRVSLLRGADGEVAGTVHVARDTRERREAEARIREQNDFLHHLLSSMSHPFYVINVIDYTVEIANEAAKKQGIAEGGKCYELTHGRDEPCAGIENPCPLAAVVKTRVSKMVEHVHQDPSGKLTCVEVHAYPIVDSEQNVTRVTEYCLDITDRKKAEELLLQTERLRAVTDLAGGVAHNFNNLLQIALSGCSLIQKSIESDDLTEALETLGGIRKSVRFGAATVKRLQDFASISQCIAVKEGEVFDLSSTVDEALAISRPWLKEAPEKGGFSIIVERDIDNRCLLFGREADIFEVVVNLLKNAIEALPEGGTVGFTTHIEGDSVLLNVKDDGVGIPKDVRRRIWEPFYTTKGPDGTGMGLSASYGIVAQHGGEISVESTIGQGSTFVVRLPRYREDLEAGVQESTVLRWKPRILAIDDLDVIVRSLQMGLHRLGCPVITACSGEEGLALLAENEVDVVICDLGMPGMSGWQVGSEIKERFERAGTRKPRFVLMTGWGSVEVSADKVSASGVDVTLNKPFDIEMAVDAIEAALAGYEFTPREP